jgi:hypothetical protein
MFREFEEQSASLGGQVLARCRNVIAALEVSKAFVYELASRLVHGTASSMHAKCVAKICRRLHLG